MKSLPNTTSEAKTTVHAPAANTAAVATIAYDDTEYPCIDWIAYSYEGGAPSGGNLLVTINSVTYLNLDIGAVMTEQLVFDPPLSDNKLGSDVVVTLAAGGAAVTGKVTAGHR